MTSEVVNEITNEAWPSAFKCNHRTLFLCILSHDRRSDGEECRNDMCQAVTIDGLTKPFESWSECGGRNAIDNNGHCLREWSKQFSVLYCPSGPLFLLSFSTLPSVSNHCQSSKHPSTRSRSFGTSTDSTMVVAEITCRIMRFFQHLIPKSEVWYMIFSMRLHYDLAYSGEANHLSAGAAYFTAFSDPVTQTQI